MNSVGDNNHPIEDITALTGSIVIYASDVTYVLCSGEPGTSIDSEDGLGKVNL